MKQKLLLALFALLTAPTVWAEVEINETNFPDENFRNWVLRQSYGQDGVLTNEEISGVTSIIAPNNRSILSLKGIEYFTALTTLHCELNQLTALDLSKNTALTSLYCYCNQLTTLDLSNNTALEHLECWENQLISINVSKNTALTYMACSRNQLTSLDISKNITLTSLSCNYNQLNSLDVSNNIMLTTLACQENQLTTLDVSKNSALKSLVCRHNLLTSINVSGCTALNSLRCSENKLSGLDVSGCPVLDDLICMSNQIKGVAMDALVESLPTVNKGHLGVINHYKNGQNEQDEQNLMTKLQVADAKAKGWYVQYNDSNNQWKNYEGSDDATGISATLNDNGEMTNDSRYDLSGRKLPDKPAQGIYIEDGKKKMK